jgi:hypothetical protein
MVSVNSLRDSQSAINGWIEALVGGILYENLVLGQVFSVSCALYVIYSVWCISARSTDYAQTHRMLPAPVMARLLSIAQCSYRYSAWESIRTYLSFLKK